MEFLDPVKRRAHRQKLFLGYGLIALALAMMTIIIVFAAYGFDIDRKTGQVIQNGMIIVDTAPESARITVNGKDEGNTNKRLSLPAGQYKIELSRDGYRTWKQDVDLIGGSIEQLVYPFLFPQNLQTKAIQDYAAAPALSSQSPDRRWLVVQRPGDAIGNFQLTDLNDKANPTTTISLPAGVASGGTSHSFETEEWSTDNVNLLLKHTYDGKTEFIRLNRETPAVSSNLTQLFAERSFTAMSLRDKRSDQFYVYNAADKSLFSLDEKTKETSQVATAVLQYKTYQKDMVLYATAAADTSKADIHLLYKGKDRVIKTVAASPTYLMDAADFSGKLYVVVGSGNDGHAYLFMNPLDALSTDPQDVPKSFRALTLAGAQHVSFSNNARFIAVQAGSKFAVYDAETLRQFRYDSQLSLAPGTIANWMDGHRLVATTSDNKVHVWDFDGTNNQQLNDGMSGGTVWFDRDYKAMFVMAAGTGAAKVSLTRTELRLNP